MPKFPNYYNSNEDLNSDVSINTRIFNMEKNVIPSTSSTNNVSTIEPKHIKHVVDADQIIHILEKELAQGNSFMLEIDEQLAEWAKYHNRQYEALQAKPFEEPKIKKTRVPDTVPKTPRELIQNEGETDEDFFIRKETPEYKKRENLYLARFNLWKRDNERYDEVFDQIGNYDEYAEDYDRRKEEHDKRYHDKIASTPVLRRYQNKDDRETQVNLKHFEPIAKSLLTTIAKTLVIINNIKVLYKHKISGINLNRFTQNEMYTIRQLLEDFLATCQKIARSMKIQKLTTTELDRPKNNDINVNIRHAFTEAEKRFQLLISSFEKMYLDDKKRYSYNQGKI